MYRIPNRRAIINRRCVMGRLAERTDGGPKPAKSRAAAVTVFRDALRAGAGEVRRRFESGGATGGEVVRANAFLIDQLIRSIHDFGVTAVFPGATPQTFGHMAVCATGGYGRAELCPYSDVDLMFLMPPGNTAATEQLVEFILYMLWDTGLQVGHATRTIDETVRLAKADLTIRTSLLEARWLLGDKALFGQFCQRFQKDVIAGSGGRYVEAKLAERETRHERMGDTRYVLEPHIKEGKGGLRDLQTLTWIARHLYHVDDIADLVDRGIFNNSDVARFRKAQSFLWTVRCHLHYLNRRPEERLTFNVQPVIGERMGYADRAGVRGVERFMKHYFTVTRTVGDLTRVLCAALQEYEAKRARRRFRLPSLNLFRRAPAGFKLDGDRLMLASPETLKENPVTMLSLFREAQRLELDIHPRALLLVQQNLGLVGAALRRDEEANGVFMDMLTCEHDPEKTLRRLNESGVFGRFVPDFGRVVAQMQYDMYHVYTVDEHTIRAIGILSRIEKGELAELHPTATAAFSEVRSRRALYLAVLLHDIAKGRGGDHSEIGAEIALTLAPRLGLDEWETETVSWLVLQHLLMSRVAFKRDVDDPKTVADFTARVQSPERLRMLMILTNADIDAVGPGIWNAWKEGLVSELYYRSLEAMEMVGGQPPQRRFVRVQASKARLRERLTDWDTETLETYIGRGYSDFWLAFDADEHARQMRLMRAADEAGEDLRIDVRGHPTHDVTEVTIYAPDHAGLFAQIAGAMALSGASIVDAKVITLANSMALDVFRIQDISGRPYDAPERIERLSRRIEATVAGRVTLAREFKAARARLLPSRTRVFKVPPRVIFDNKASATATVIEVNGRDRAGFLHDVTATLTSLSLQVVSAHISTYGERVVDVFYVKDVFGLKIDQPQKLKRIKRELLESIEPPEAAAEPAPDKPADTAEPIAAE
jgi:[protein-PII] uridylyltransferase